MSKTLLERFHSKTKRAAEILPGMSTPCLEWQAGKDKDGYGKFLYGRAHRAAWSMKNGDIPIGSRVLHKCDNPSCVEVSHLFLGTNSDNMHDMVRKGRSMRGERNCKAKLKESDVVAIFRMRSNGYELKPIARAFGVSHQLVSAISHRHVWSHITAA